MKAARDALQAVKDSASKGSGRDTAELDARVDDALRELDAAEQAMKDEVRGARRKHRLEVAAKARQALGYVQSAPMPGEWTDGAAQALGLLLAEIEAVPDDEPGA